MMHAKHLLTAGAISAFSFSLAFGFDTGEQRQQQQQPGAQPGQQEQQEETEDLDAALEEAEQEFGFADRGEENEVHKLSELKGKSVKSQDGEEIGEIEEVAVNLDDGEASFVLISSEDNGEWHPVPPGALQVSGSGEDLEVQLNIEQGELGEAPTVEREEIAQLDQQGQEIYQFYGEDWDARQEQVFGAPDRDRDNGEDEDREPGQFGAREDAPGQQDDEAREHAPGQQDDEAREHAPGQRMQDDEQEEEEREFGARPDRDRDNGEDEDRERGQFGAREDAPGQQDDEAREHAPGQQDGEAREHAPGQRMQDDEDEEEEREFGARTDRQQQTGMQQEGGEGQLKLSEEVMEAALLDENDEEIGKISDMLINLQEGRISFVILDTEEAEDNFAVSAKALESVGDDQIRLNVTREDFEDVQSLSLAEAPQHAQEQEQQDVSQLRESPEIYRFEAEEETDVIFGAPERDRDDAQERNDEDEDEQPGQEDSIFQEEESRERQI